MVRESCVPIPLLLVHVEGCEGRVGSTYVNHSEAHGLCHFLHHMGPQWSSLGLSMGVITPYKAQLELMRMVMDWFDTILV